MIFGIDAGNYATKVVTSNGAFQYLSCLGEWREREVDLNQSFGSDDIEYEYQGRKGFAGALAKEESLFVREMAGDTKAHQDAVLRVLIAIHLFGNYERTHQIVVGQPIKKHAKDKKRIVDMIKGFHAISVNGEEKKFMIEDVSVVPEGAGVYWSYRDEAGKLRIIDVGSGTVNCATINEGRFINRDSFTLSYGANSQEGYEVNRLAEAIIAATSKRWQKQDKVIVSGGVAEDLIPYLDHYSDIKANKPMVKSGVTAYKAVHPTFGNAAGFYEVARALYEKS